MKLKNYILIPLTLVLFYSLTGCYTQVATSEPYSTTTYYEKSDDSYDYYSEEGELLDSSSYLEETYTDNADLVIVNKYYGYPYYDYYPSILIGFGFNWYWGWGWASYYPYWSYYPYYSGWWGCGWYNPYPYYCYYPGYYPNYYCYDPYYGYPYYGYNDYYPYYGSYPRDQYVTRVRNNSGGRNNPGYNGNPRDLQTSGSIDRVRDDIALGRDLSTERTNVKNSAVDIRNNTGEITRQVVGLNDLERIDNNKRKDVSSTELTRTTEIKKDKQQYGLDREGKTTKSLGINNTNDIRNKINTSNDLKKYTDRINKNNRIGNETKKIFNQQNSNRNDKNVKSKTDTRKSNVSNVPRQNQTPKKNTDSRSYNPPKQNNNQPRTYSQPKSNNNSPRSYSPPTRTNNTPRSYSPPSRNSGSNNSGTRKR